jgi:nucleotide-binding universal stress UspA family protein
MKQIRNIVVATDFSEQSHAAAARAATLARLDGASVHLVHSVRFPMLVTPYEVSVPASVIEGVITAARERLEEARTSVEEMGVATVTAELSETIDAVNAIAASVESKNAELVVMGTHGFGGLKHAFLGSVAERTIRSVDCPVLAVKEEHAIAEQPIEKILVAVDFSAHSDRAVDVAVGLGKRLEASLDIVHAFDLPVGYAAYSSPVSMELEQKIETYANEQLAGLGERLEDSQLQVNLHCLRGRPSAKIAETAEQIGCQLIVMGTRGKSGLAHVFLGSVAERTLRLAPCSVLTVKADEA